MTFNEFKKQFIPIFSEKLKEYIPEIKTNYIDDGYVAFGFYNDTQRAVDIQTKYEGFLAICNDERIGIDSGFDVSAYAKLVALKCSEQVSEAYKIPSSGKIVLTLLPKSRLDSMGNIPYKPFGKNMGICLAHDSKNQRRYLSDYHHRVFKLNFTEAYGKYWENLQIALYFDKKTWMTSMIKDVSILRQDNAASLLLISEFWENEKNLVLSFPFKDTKKSNNESDLIVSILDQHTLSMTKNHEVAPFLNSPLGDHDYTYDGETFILKDGKFKSYVPIWQPTLMSSFTVENKDDAEKENENKNEKKWWQFWK